MKTEIRSFKILADGWGESETGSLKRASGLNWKTMETIDSLFWWLLSLLDDRPKQTPNEGLKIASTCSDGAQLININRHSKLKGRYKDL